MVVGGLVPVTYPMCIFIVVLKGWDIEWAYDEIYSRIFYIKQESGGTNTVLFIWIRHIFWFS